MESKQDNKKSTDEKLIPEIDSGRFKVCLAATPDDLCEVQKFRYAIFSSEAQLRNDEGLDSDFYDPFCDHIMVLDRENNALVGTYRLHPGARLESTQAFYCENEYIFGHFPYKRREILELGRSCVHPDFRKGVIIQLLWMAITAYMDAGGFELLLGAASVPVEQGGRINRLAGYLAHQAAAPLPYQCLVQDGYRLTRSHQTLLHYRRYISPSDMSMHDFVPPLLKGYLNLGAWIASPPALDREFGTFDFLVLLPKANIHPVYLKRYRRQLQVIRNERAL